MTDVNGTGVNGTVAAGFEPVARELGAILRKDEERGLAVAVTVGGEPVVDLWGGRTEDGLWAENTAGLVFSVTKGAAAMCVQILSDRGLLDIDAPVATYWPEYAAAGKDRTLVRHVLNHTAAQYTYPGYWRDIGPDGEGLVDHELIAKRLAEAAPAWAPGTRPMYHAITYGYLLDELVRRVDGRTLGDFFRDEVAKPLQLDYWIGLPDEHTGRLARPLATAPLKGRALAHRRRLLELAREHVRSDEVFHETAWPYAMILAHPDNDDPLDLARLARQPWFVRASLPASSGVATARSLARMYALLAAGGALGDVRLVSPESVVRFADKAESGGGGFALGYGLLPPMVTALGISPGSFGSAGAGGSLAIADPVRRVSFALTKNQMIDSPGTAVRLLAALYRVLDRGGPATRIRRRATARVVSSSALARSVQWAQTFRSPARGFPVGSD